MTETRLYEALAEQAWDFAQNLPGARRRQTAFGEVVTSQAPTGAGNYLFVSPRGGYRLDNYDKAAGIRELFPNWSSYPWEVSLPEPFDGARLENLYRAGLRPAGSEATPVMFRNGSGADSDGVENGLTIEPNEHDVGEGDAARVLAKSFHSKEWLARWLVFDAGPTDDNLTKFFFGSDKHGRLVAVSAVTYTGSRRPAVLSSIAVAPGFRHRGHGRAMTVAAMRWAKQTYPDIDGFVLRSSELGKSLYARLGFEERGSYRTLTYRPSFFDRARNVAVLRRLAQEAP